MKPYRLLILSLPIPTTPEGIRCSVEMLAYGLWRDFAKLGHVHLQFQNVAGPLTVTEPVDFVLVHSYFSVALDERLWELRPFTRREILCCMECPMRRPLADHCFTFLPADGVTYAEQIRCPCIGDLIDDYRGEKTPGSVLLDHVWGPYDGTDNDWSNRLYDWLKSGYRWVAQLRRGGHDEKHHFPPGIIQIAERGYPQYLSATAGYENFIVTHPGSYEHSVIDMAARGTRVLVPLQAGKPFVPQALVDDLHLPVFGSRKELLDILSDPIEQQDVRHTVCTDMPEVVQRIDGYCQRVLSP